jgi:predicted metalloendopeptidase
VRQIIYYPTLGLSINILERSSRGDAPLCFVMCITRLIFFHSQISLPNEQRRNASKLYNPKSVAELQKEYSFIPWTEYFANILPPNIKIEDSEIVIINVASYLKDLEKLLSETPKRFYKENKKVSYSKFVVKF